MIMSLQTLIIAYNSTCFLVLFCIVLTGYNFTKCNLDGRAVYTQQPEVVNSQPLWIKSQRQK